MDIVITWKTPPENPGVVIYFINEAVVGENDEGFEKILHAVRLNKNAKVVLKIQRVPSLGGGSLRDSLPFKRRFGELQRALGSNKLVYEFI